MMTPSAAHATRTRCRTARSRGSCTSRRWNSGWSSRALPDGEFKFVLNKTTLWRGREQLPGAAQTVTTLEVQTRDKGYILAWDPVKQKTAFRVPSESAVRRWHDGDCGQLARAGDDGSHAGCVPC